jgi:HEAT repeats
MLVAVLGTVIWLMFHLVEPEPQYQGKPLTYWLQGFSPAYPPATNGYARPTYQEARDAVENLGTNAIPVLLRLLRTPDNPLKDWFFRLVQRQHIIRISYAPTQTFALVNEAKAAFDELAGKGVAAMPQLMKIYDQHPNVYSRQIVPAILAGIGPPAKPAIPLLLRATTDADSYVRNNAVYALGRIGAEPALAVPALTKCLEDPADFTRANAAGALATLGTNARPAIPVLIKLLAREQTNSAAVTLPTSGRPGNFTTVWGGHPGGGFFGNPIDVIGPTTAALKTIDPEAAAKAGIK